MVRRRGISVENGLKRSSMEPFRLGRTATTDSESGSPTQGHGSQQPSIRRISWTSFGSVAASTGRSTWKFSGSAETGVVGPKSPSFLGSLSAKLGAPTSDQPSSQSVRTPGPARREPQVQNGSADQQVVDATMTTDSAWRSRTGRLAPGNGSAGCRMPRLSLHQMHHRSPVYRALCARSGGGLRRSRSPS